MYVVNCEVQETRWTGSGSSARVMGMGMSRYKFLCKDGNAGVEFRISDRWIDSIVNMKSE